MAHASLWFWTMDLSARLIALRKQQGLSQQAMAEAVGLHVNQIKRYEAGTAQPSLDGLKKLAVALHVTTDSLLFGESERGPDEGLLLQFEAISQFDEEDRDLARGVLEGLILKHQAKQSLLRQAAHSAPAKKPDVGSKRKAHTAAAHR